MITRKTTQGQFLLRPDDETKNAFIYCLGVASQRHKVDVMGFIQMSNHLHDMAYDRHGTGPAFYEDFHKLLAKCMNAYHRRTENFFSSEQVNVVRVVGVEDVVDKLGYIATNPVKHDLVEYAKDWPGAQGYEALLTGTTLTAYRPKFFFAKDSSLPAKVTLTLSIPPELGDASAILDSLRERVEAIEQEHAKRRATNKLRVMGVEAVKTQSSTATAKTVRPRRDIRPTIAAKNLQARLTAIQQKRAFVEAYRSAREALLSGNPKPFPYGTYWLRRFANVDVEPAEKLN